MLPSYDLHVHTYLSACCHAKEEQRPAGIVALAHAMGLEAVGFADHLWVQPAIEPSGWYRPQDETQIARLREDLAHVEVPAGLRVLVGCEAETIAPGVFGMTPEFAATLDYVLLSCSHIHMKGFVAQPADEEPRTVGTHLLSLFRSGLMAEWVTAIAHPLVPFGRMAQYDAIIAALGDAELLDAFGLAAEQGVGLEITTTFLPPEPPEQPAEPDTKPWSLETPVRLLTLAKQAGVRFTFGSDAHAPDHQRALPKLSRLLDAAGIVKADILPLV